MKRTLYLAILSIIPLTLSAFEKLNDRYLVTYGNPEAPHRIVEYISFTCPNCIELFKDDFADIRERYIDSEKTYWVFHPMPVDLLTVQAMACLEKLSEYRKRIFLEEMLSFADENQPKDVAHLMSQIMALLDGDARNVANIDELEKTEAWEAAYQFLKGGGLSVEAVPSIEMDGELMEELVPSLKIISALFRSKEEKEAV